MINTPGSLIPLEANIMYCSTKAGLHMFTLILRRQLRESGVRVMEVFPPGLETGLARDLAVPSQGQKPESALRDTSVAIVDSILNGEEVILPHPESEFLYNNFAPKLDPDLIDKMNLGVQRRPGWNA
jgi:short-subunit dehydrogenase involved in D-alanine esterification of teichoic acids